MKFIGRVALFFLSAVVSVLKMMWIPAAALLAVQACLLYVALSEFTVPPRLVEALLVRLEKEGLRVSVGEVRLRKLTVLTADDVRVDMLRGGDPLLRVRRVAVKLAPEALISRNFVPRVVCADGAELFCPAAHSATGRAERLVSSASLNFSPSGEMLELDALKFRIGDFACVVHGSVPATRSFFFGEEEGRAADTGVPASASVSDGVSAEPTSCVPAVPAAAALGRLAGKISSMLHGVELPQFPGSLSAEIRIFPEGDSAVSADVSVSAPEVVFSERAILKNAVATQRFSVRPSTGEILPRGLLRAEAGSFSFALGENFSERIFGKAERVFAAAALPAMVFSANAAPRERLPGRIFAGVGSVRATSLLCGETELRGLAAVVSPAEAGNWAFPGAYRVIFDGSLGSTLLACAGTVFAAPEASSLDFAYEISLNKGDVLSFPQLRSVAMQEDVRRLRFAEQPDVRGRVVLGPGMKFERANVEFSSGLTTCGDLLLRRIDAAGTVFADSVHFPEIRVLGPDFLANADVFTEFSSDGDFRVRTWGSVDPSYIDGRLGWFWERIWRDLWTAPSERRPRADIDVYGNWGENWEHVFGAIAGENGFGNGVLVDKVRLRVYEDPLLIAAFDMGFERGDDRVEGTLQWHYAMEPEYHYRDFRFLFNGTIPPADVLQIVGEGLPEALPDLETAGAGTATVSGMFSGDERYYPERMLVNVRGGVPGKFSIFGIRGEDFRGEIIYDNGVVFVGGPFSARAGAGTVSGSVSVRLPEDGQSLDGALVGLKLDLKGVTRFRLEEAFASIGEHIEAPAVPAESDSVPAPAAAAVAKAEEKTAEKQKRKEEDDRSSIDAVFAGTLTLPDIRTMKASGKFSVHEEKLFEIQIFSGFSRLLSSLGIDLPSFELNRVESAYTVHDGSVSLSNLRVLGNSAEIDICADVSLPDLAIQGEAVFRNLRGTRIPLLGKFVEWGSASTELLPAEINGSVTEPEWKISPTLPAFLGGKNGGNAPKKSATDGKSVVPAGTAAAGADEDSGKNKSDDEQN